MACQGVVNLKRVNEHFSTGAFFFYLHLLVAFVWIIKNFKRRYIVVSFFCLLPRGPLPCHESVFKTLKYYFFTHSLQWEWSSCLVAFQRQEGRGAERALLKPKSSCYWKIIIWMRKAQWLTTVIQRKRKRCTSQTGNQWRGKGIKTIWQIWNICGT